MRRALFITLLVLLATGCQSTPEPDRTDYQPLILVSIDGLRPDDIGLANTPHLDQLAEQGVKAEWMEPVFPSSTFPNHYSIVTGLYPAQHGIVANRMRDSESEDPFTLYDRDQVTDGFWWQGEPIWVTAEKQGQRAAAMFWPGSEAPIQDTRPSYYATYEHEMPHRERIQQVLEWLDLPVDERPQFLTLYFSTVDSAGHEHGPGSAEVIAELEKIDSDLGYLLAELRKRRLLDSSHLLVVSDHGMAALDPERRIFIDDRMPLERLDPSLYGPVAFFWPEPQHVNALAEALKDEHPAMTVAKPEDLPAALRFSGHRRIPPLVAIAEPGWVITHRGPDAPYRDGTGGAHGYDPRTQEMRAVFLASSPAMRRGAEMGPIKNLDLYPLMAHLLGLEPAPNEGSLERFSAVLLD